MRIWGVILGIIFLAIEIQQNNELLAAQNRFNRLSVAAESATILSVNPDLAGYLIRANNGEDLAPDEKMRLDSYLRRTLTNMEWGFLELPEEDLPLETWRRLYNQHYRHQLWNEIKGIFDSRFVEYMDEYVYGQTFDLETL